MFAFNKNTGLGLFTEHKNKPSATVYTPSLVSSFIFKLVHDKIDKDKPIFDPCVGRGALVMPFLEAGFTSIHYDIEDQGFGGTIVCDYLDQDAWIYERPSLVVMNPPWNVDKLNSDRIIIRDENRIKGTTKASSRIQITELFLDKTFQLFGKDIPLVLLCNQDTRGANARFSSRRYLKFLRHYPDICSIITLPTTIFEIRSPKYGHDEGGRESRKYSKVRSEIIIFNLQGLEPHYFLKEKSDG